MKQSCPYCGNNPAPHFLTWYFESLDILLKPVRIAFVYNPVMRAWRKFLKSIHFGWNISRLLLRARILSRYSDPAQCKVRRAQVLWEEAGRRGIEFYGLRIFGKNLDMYMARKGERKLFIEGLPRPAGSDQRLIEVLDDKVDLKQTLRKAGLPAPQGGTAATQRAAVQIFRGLTKPVIVKPRTGSRGRHTTTYIYSEDELKQAVRVAKQLCSWVVVEEHLLGPVYRATVIGGKLAGVLRGDPPQVVGDGKRTIGELIDVKNAQPHPGVKDVMVTDEMNLFLSRQELSLTSIPESGRIINLSEKIGVNYGGASSEDYNICHPDNKELFLRAAATLGDPLIGFDFIIPDITKSYKEQRCGFIEANSLPFINLHHDPLHGTPRNAAALVWDMMGW